MISESGAQPAPPPLIRRVQKTSDETSPWEGISFTQPIGSDSLSDDLRRAYPGCLDLRQRKHMAAIAFLQHELMQMQSSNPTTKLFESDCHATPKDSSLCNDNFDGNSRQSSVSVVSQSSFQRTQSWSAGNLDPMQSQTFTSSGVSSSQQIVFSVSDGHTLQPTTRRPMTREEKVAYRKTRKRGACSTCRRQKGKCTHVSGTVAGSRISDETSKLQKSIAHDKTEKLRRPGSSVPNTELVVSPESQHNITNTTSIATALRTHQQSSKVPADSHWSQAIDQGTQSDAARYVHNANMNTPGGPMPFQPGPPWQGYPVATNIQSRFNPRYSQTVLWNYPRILCQYLLLLRPHQWTPPSHPNFWILYTRHGMIHGSPIKRIWSPANHMYLPCDLQYLSPLEDPC
ncbi:hypothetical protein DE146DRAFT_176547 [Phaeosphaeria sp. MPI-PUGE-AT-0046c]|nr:hypothetical protein DE146DRAFT_176547 [Phaeosphaeria sp. MPI-PUGE-AT-0046c]